MHQGQRRAGHLRANLETLPSPPGMNPGDNVFISFLEEKPGKTLNVVIGELGSACGLITHMLGVCWFFPTIWVQWGPQAGLGTNPAWGQSLHSGASVSQV